MKTMKNGKLILSSFLIALACAPACAQWQRTPTPNDTLQSVRVLNDGRVVLSIYAPQAREVSVGGDVAPWGQKPEVTKSASGVWSVTVPAVKDGVYRYHFVVDGVKVYDPKAPTASETSALLQVGNPDEAFYSMKEGVPHGAIAQRYYYSKTLKTMRRLHVWTPAGYETGTEKLPVLYLIHGGGDTDLSWPTVGCAGNILDNLLAEGKMEPMVVVMPNGSIEAENLMDEVPLFADDLMGGIIPYIESNYRVLADKDHRALAGLSMGGMETLEAGLNNYREFGYLWVLSSGWFADDKDMYAERGAYLKKIAADFNRTVRSLHFTQGGPEDIAYKNCQAMLKLFDEAGVKYTYSEAPGGHTWYTWRNDLFNMAQQLFKK